MQYCRHWLRICGHGHVHGGGCKGNGGNITINGRSGTGDTINTIEGSMVPPILVRVFITDFAVV